MSEQSEELPEMLPLGGPMGVFGFVGHAAVEVIPGPGEPERPTVGQDEEQ